MLVSQDDLLIGVYAKRNSVVENMLGFPTWSSYLNRNGWTHKQNGWELTSVSQEKRWPRQQARSPQLCSTSFKKFNAYGIHFSVHPNAGQCAAHHRKILQKKCML